jgi:hypothetical protein
MKIVIEFYRIREIDDAKAIVGRESVVASDLDEAIGIGRRLVRLLDMPQRPDGMAVTDGQGNRLYSSLLDESD